MNEMIRNVVLVHGGFVDGSGWEGVYKILKNKGFQVSIVQHPTISLEDDVAATKRVLAGQEGPVILVGHSYGGVVVTEAGNDPKVTGLVYIAAFVPDKGESVSSLIKNPPPGAPVPPILPPKDGFLFLDRAKFPASFAADLDSEAGRVPGRLAVALGRGGAQRQRPRAGLEGQAELVPGGHGGQDDPTARTAADVQARGGECGGGQWQPCDLRVEARGRCCSDRARGPGHPVAATLVTSDATPGARADAHRTAEDAGEMALARESADGCDLVQGLGRMLEQPSGPCPAAAPPTSGAAAGPSIGGRRARSVGPTAGTRSPGPTGKPRHPDERPSAPSRDVPATASGHRAPSTAPLAGRRRLLPCERRWPSTRDPRRGRRPRSEERRGPAAWT